MEYRGPGPDIFLLEQLAAADPLKGLIWGELLALLQRDRLQMTLRQLTTNKYVRIELMYRFNKAPLRHYIITAEGRAELVLQKSRRNV